MTKKIIIGTLGTGKTTFIVEKLLDMCPAYTVLDFCKEYHQWLPDENIQTFNNRIGDKLKKEVTDYIRQTDKNKVLVIDNAMLLYQPQLVDGQLTDGLLWLYDLLKDREFILVFQSFESFVKGGITDLHDELFCFPTRDDDYVRTKIMALQVHMGKSVFLMPGFQPHAIPKDRPSIQTLYKN